MGCLCSIFENCCRRVGCSCKDNKRDGVMTSIEQNRVCTDIPCIGIFGIFIGVMVFYVWIEAFVEGDPDRLISGVNFAGQICGESDGVKDLPYAFWPDLTNYKFKVCTADCSATQQGTLNHIYLGPDAPQPLGAVGYESKLFLNRYCRPTLDSLESLEASPAILDEFNSGTATAERAIGDLKIAMPLFGWTFLVALIMSFVFIFMMKCCVGVFVWTMILLILVCGYGMGYILYKWSTDDDDLDKKEKNVRLIAGIIFWVVTTIFFFIVIFARKRIKIATEVIKSASRALADMPFMVLFPVPVSIVFAGFFFAWAYGAIYIFSAGEEKQIDIPDYYDDIKGLTFAAQGPGSAVVKETYPRLDYHDTIKNAFAPHFFMLLWVVQIFVYFTFMVIAGAVADWYFTARDEKGDKKRGMGEGELSRIAVCNSCVRAARYHLGSVIFAAAIIAIIQFIRAVVAYIESQLNPGDKAPNMIQKALFRCVDCMLWCLECCLDKVNRNALVWVTVYGDAFCPSVCGSFMIIWSNLFRVAVITFFSGLVTLLGKILIPIMSTGIMALILMNVDKFDQLSSPILPLVIIFIISFGVAQLFMTVYDTAIDTIFMCFLIDEKHNKNGGQMMADENLREIVQKYEAESKELATSKTRNSRNKDEKGGGDKADDTDVDLQV